MVYFLNIDFIAVLCLLTIFTLIASFKNNLCSEHISGIRSSPVISGVFALLSLILSLDILTSHNLYGIIASRIVDSDLFAGLLLFFISVIFIKGSGKFGDAITFSSIFFISLYLLILRTRTGFAAIVVGLAGMGFTYYFYRKGEKEEDAKNLKFNLGITGSIFLVAVLVSTVLPPISEDRSSLLNTTASIFDKDYHSNKLRLMYWDASLNMFRDKPITGIGTGQWTGMAPKYIGGIFNDGNKGMNLFYSAHNDYLEMLAEYGIWGISYTILIFTGIYLLFRKTLKDINHLPYLVTAVGLSVTSFFNFTHENIWTMCLFMFCLGMGYKNIAARIFNRFIPPEKRKIIFIVSISLLSFGIIGFKTAHFYFEKQYISAINLKMQGNYKEMIAELDKIPEWIYSVDMNKMPVSFYRGTGNFELGNYEEALTDFRNAKVYSRYFPTVMMNEASACYATGRTEEAIQILRELKQIAPNYIEPQVNLLSIFTNLKMDNESKGLISEIDNRKFDPKYVKNYGVFVQIKNYFSKTGN